MTDAPVQAARALLADTRRIVSFTGAGLSAESGVATFRDAPDALWENFDPMDLASPQGFAREPQLVSDWYAWRRRVLADAHPNPAHLALAARADLVHITQNVDNLLQRAGVADVIRLHGTIDEDRCHGDCGYCEPIDLADPPPLRTCPRCDAPMRPAVTWFGESLPEDAWAAAESACRSCETLLVVGTSAVVYPAAGLIGYARSRGAAVVVVNTEASGASDIADVEVIGKAGEVLPELLG